MASSTAPDHLEVKDFTLDDRPGGGLVGEGARPKRRTDGLTKARTFALLVALGVVAAVVYLGRTRGWTATTQLIGESAHSTWRAVGATSMDAAMSAKIKTALALSKHVSASDIHVDSRDGYVLLSGHAPTEDVKQMAGTIARDTTGVREVHNHLTVVGPASGADAAAATAQTLAYRVEFNLYVTRAFDLSLIRIEATDRTVILSGSARNQAEKLLAEKLAAESEGVQKVVSHLDVLPDQSP